MTANRAATNWSASSIAAAEGSGGAKRSTSASTSARSISWDKHRRAPHLAHSRTSTRPSAWAARTSLNVITSPLATASTRSITSAAAQTRGAADDGRRHADHRDADDRSNAHSACQNASPNVMNHSLARLPVALRHLESEVARGTGRPATCSGTRTRAPFAVRQRAQSDTVLNTLPTSAKPTTLTPLRSGTRSSPFSSSSAVAAQWEPARVERVRLARRSVLDAQLIEREAPHGRVPAGEEAFACRQRVRAGGASNRRAKTRAGRHHEGTTAGDGPKALRREERLDESDLRADGPCSHLAVRTEVLPGAGVDRVVARVPDHRRRGTTRA